MKYLLKILAALGITKETAKRAGRTFLQTAIGYIAVNLSIVDFSAGADVIKSALCGVAVSAIAAGIAAVMNREKQYTESEGVE